MKKILSALVVIIFGKFMFAQSLTNNTVSENGEVTASITAPASDVYLNAISAKAVRHLKKTFGSVTYEKWYVMPDGYRANFTLKGIYYRLDYDKKGNWLHTIKYYDVRKLPTEVRRLVVSTYLDYTITKIEEIEIPKNSIFYIVHLEGQNNWINVKVSDGEIFEFEKIVKLE